MVLCPTLMRAAAQALLDEGGPDAAGLRAIARRVPATKSNIALDCVAKRGLALPASVAGFHDGERRPPPISLSGRRGWRDIGAASALGGSLTPAPICLSGRTVAEERPSLPPARRKPTSAAAPAPSVAELGKAEGARLPFDWANGPQQAAGRRQGRRTSRRQSARLSAARPSWSLGRQFASKTIPSL